MLQHLANASEAAGASDSFFAISATGNAKLVQ